MRFYATCPTGLEHLLAQELESLGVPSVRPLQGQVGFEGPLKWAYVACLWSRIASSVVAVVESGPVTGAETLYDLAAAIPWEDHLPVGATFAVYTSGTMEGLDNTLFTSQKVKDAVVDRMLAAKGTRPNVDTDDPDLRIRVRIREGHATMGIDMSGEPLFRRGYEKAARRAAIPPQRPDYAAAVLELAGWWRTVRRPMPSVCVAFSGGGTLAVEAASVALDRAPGLLRVRWGFSRWLGHSERSWSQVRNEAERRAAAGAKNPLVLVVSDTREGFGADCRALLNSAGIDREPVVVPAREVSRAGAELTEDRLVAVDLAWLHADEAAREAEALSYLTGLCSGLPEGTPACTLARDGALDALLGIEPEDEVESLMGKNNVYLRGYADIAMDPPAAVTLKDGSEVPVLVPVTDQFAARLEKDAKERSKWAEAEDVTCYRVYDQDLPDYNVAIDLFRGAPQTPGRWLVVSEYAAPSEIDPEKARRRLIDVLTVAPRVLGVRGRDVALRVRHKAKGGSQYAAPEDITRTIKARELARNVPGRPARKPKARYVDGVELPEGCKLVEEGGLTFEINLVDRLDCGLFLDHRDVRAEIREMAKQMRGSKRFLNLFAYTGTGTVYAADGGAGYTTTVDLSYTYIDWARRNMQRNGFDGEEHEYVKADVLRWVDEQRKTRNRWDLVFCDPPTFSNSSSMGERSFDVQRDHSELLIGISRLLTRDGVCLFSCNLRDFTPDVEKLDRCGVTVEDVTERTIPHDFERNSKVHHVYIVRRKPMSEEKRAEIEARKARGDHAGKRAPDSRYRGDRRPGGFGGGRDGHGRGNRRDGRHGSDGRTARRPGGFRARAGRDNDRRGGGHGGKADRRGGFKGGRPGSDRGGFKGGDRRDPRGAGPSGNNRRGQGREGGNRH